MRIVRESLYNFHKTGDVKSGLNIGIRTKIKAWLDEMDVENYIINGDYSIDVNGDVKIENKGLTEFPSFIKFREVKGYFSCSKNKLNNLSGVPQIVKENFYCYRNNLTNLNGSPYEIRGVFDCSENKLTSLNGAPSIVRWDFHCNRNKLTSLEGAPLEVGGAFFCSENSEKFTKEEVREVCNVKGGIYV